MKKNSKEFKSVDTLSKELDIVDNFVLKYWKKYVIGAIIILVAIGVYFIFSSTRYSNGAAVVKKILAASSTQQLKEVIKSYPEHSITQYVELKLASMLAKTTQWTEATSLYDKLANSGNNNYTVYAAKLYKAYLTEMAGKPEESVKLFSQISDDSTLPVIFRAESEYSAGRIYFSLGNKSMASKYLQRCANIETKECLGWPEMAQSLLNRIN